MPETFPKISSLLDAWKITHPEEKVFEVVVPERPKLREGVDDILSKR